MRKIKRKIILFCLVTILLCCAINAKADEYTLKDQTGDIYYQPGGGEQTQTDLDTQPNIDIEYVKYETTENTVSIIINVVGTIQDSKDQVLYYGEYSSADAVYQFRLSNNNINAYVESGGSKSPTEAQYQAEGDTLTVTFDLATDDTSLGDLYGYGHYYENPDELIMGPKYVDTTSDIENIDPSEGGGSSSNNGGSTGEESPGFTLLLIIASIALLFIMKKIKNGNFK